MSLILEALRKLDREKHVPERGFLVIAPTPWPASGRGRLPLAVAGLLSAMAVGGGLAYWLLQPRPILAPVAAPVQSSATPGMPAAPRESSPIVPPLSIQEPFAAAAKSEPTEPTTRANVPAPVTRAIPAAEIAPASPTPSTPDSATIPTPAPKAISTVPAATIQRPAAPFVLQAISSRDGRPVAVLNGRTLFEGDVFDGVTVIKIGVDTVEIEVDGKVQIIRF